ncbi:unnamed protein product [Camellia sinensis]
MRSPATKKDTHFLALKMVMEQYLQEAEAQNESVEYGASVEKWNSVSATVDESEDNPSIGLTATLPRLCAGPQLSRFAVTSIVGLAFTNGSISRVSLLKTLISKNHNALYAKAEVSQRSLVPLYGRGQSAKSSETKSPHLGIVVPRRPPSPTSCGVHTH